MEVGEDEAVGRGSEDSQVLEDLVEVRDLDLAELLDGGSVVVIEFTRNRDIE